MANEFANIQETLIGLGFKPQSDIGTPSLAADLLAILKDNEDVPSASLRSDTDAEFLGKGNSFATQTYKSHKEGTFPFEGILTTANLAVMGWQCMGGIAKAGTGPFDYTITPKNLVTQGLNMHYVTFVTQIRPPGQQIDVANVGVSLQEFSVRMEQGPGINNSRISGTYIMSGREVSPSGIVLPARTAEFFLNAASLQATIIGTDYVALSRFVSLEWGYSNEIPDTQIYPGSGTQDGFAVGGRIEIVRQVPFLRMVVRLADDSDEYTKLVNQTQGSAVISQVATADEQYTLTFPQCQFTTREVSNDQGIVTLELEVIPLYAEGTGIMELVVKTALDGIGGT